PVDARREQRLEVVGDLDVLDHGLYAPGQSFFVAHEHTAIDEGPHDLLDKERVALRFAQDERTQRCGEIGAAQQAVYQHAGVGVRQPFQRDLGVAVGILRPGNLPGIPARRVRVWAHGAYEQERHFLDEIEQVQHQLD